MNNSRRRVPAGAQLDAIGTGELRDAVVAGFIGEQALAHLFPWCSPGQSQSR